MITIGYCTKESNINHTKHLIKTCGLGDKKVEVIEIVNKGDRSLTECYNEILKRAKYNHVVFCHDDITIETSQWGTKLLKQFARNPEYGIIGVAGTKHLPSSGRWWEQTKKMYGRVAHTHEGKTWLSSYSNDLGHNIEKTIIVDGVFFAVDKRLLLATFDEEVKGFHFYDVTFCFENYIKGVNIGVSTMIRVNHQSIGMTNDAWELNRQNFAENYKQFLPCEIKRTLRKGEKLNVLIGCLKFASFTGSELYVLELAKGLIKENCNVSIWSSLGSPLKEIAHSYGIQTYDISTPPTFKRGDGKWLLKTVDGEVPSTENVLYKVSPFEYDIIHSNHKPITENLVKLFPNTPVITSIHSEVISLEEPFIHDNVKKFIAIRPEIKDYLINKFNIEDDKIDVIYNPIDTTRFKVVNHTEKKDKERVLFIGTIDYLRGETIVDLVNTTKEENQELWIVGAKLGNYLDDLLLHNPHVKYFPPTNKPEKFIQQCDITAGILLGRTTIESWLCGKKSWIYTVNDAGNIISKELHDVPNDLNKFKNEVVVKEIINEYLEII